MIQGVQCKPLQVHLDDRCTFMELLREDDPFYTRFGQSNFSITYPGVVKAWHFHNQQDDLWFVVSGTGQVGLHDWRLHGAVLIGPRLWRCRWCQAWDVDEL